MAKTKKTVSPAAAKKTSPGKMTSNGFSGSPRRKSSELKGLEAVSTRGSRRINLLKMIDCNEGVQLIHMEVPGKREVEGFARDLIVMVTDGNVTLNEMFITSIGERRSLDGSDTARKNHRGYWCRVVIRIAEKPETLDEKRSVLDKVAAVSCISIKNQIALISNNLPFLFVVLTYILQLLNVPEHNSYGNLFMVDDNWLDNPGGPVKMDTVTISSTVLSTLKLLYGVHDDQGILKLPTNWAIENPLTFANFFTPENMTFTIAAEVGANLAAFMPRRLNFEEEAEVIEIEEEEANEANEGSE